MKCLIISTTVGCLVPSEEPFKVLVMMTGGGHAVMSLVWPTSPIHQRSVYNICPSHSALGTPDCFRVNGEIPCSMRQCFLYGDFLIFPTVSRQHVRPTSLYGQRRCGYNPTLFHLVSSEHGSWRLTVSLQISMNHRTDPYTQTATMSQDVTDAFIYAKNFGMLALLKT